MTASALKVFVGDVAVGLLEYHDEFHCVFSFDPEWLRTPGGPVLGQLFEDRRPVDIRAGGLPLWFQHLLPQGPLRRAIAKNAGIDPNDDWALLGHLGEDLPGAVVVRPAPARVAVPGASAPAVMAASAHPLRFALAGMQWKMSLRGGERGLTVAVDGHDTCWIAKFASHEFPGLPRVEYATMEWARRSGVEVPRFRRGDLSELEVVPSGIPLEDGRLFLIERFDRPVGAPRVHMEDFAQILDRTDPYDGKYEEIVAVYDQIADVGVGQLIQQIVFCLLSGNTDAHLKNFSVLYLGGGTLSSAYPGGVALSPAYDLVSSVLYTPRIRDELALSIGGSKRFEDLSLSSFDRLRTLVHGEVPSVQELVEGMAYRTRQVWLEARDELEFTAEERSRIDAHLARIRL